MIHDRAYATHGPTVERVNRASGVFGKTSVSIADIDALKLDHRSPFARPIADLRGLLLRKLNLPIFENRPGTLVVPRPGEVDVPIVASHGMVLQANVRTDVTDEHQTAFVIHQESEIRLVVPPGFKVATTPLGQTRDRYGQQLTARIYEPGLHQMSVYSQVEGDKILLMELWSGGKRVDVVAARIPEVSSQTKRMDFDDERAPQLADGTALIRNVERRWDTPMSGAIEVQQGKWMAAA